MTRGSSLAVVIALLALTAGCNSVPDDAPDREPYGVDETVDSSLESEERGSEADSDANANGDTEPPPDDLLQDGLTTDGIVDRRAFYENYRAAVANQPRTYHVEKRYVDDAGIVQGETRRLVQIDPADDQVFVFERTESVRTEPAEPVAREYWIENGVSIERVDPENGPVEYRANSPRQTRTTPLWVVHALGTNNVTVTERDDSTRLEGRTSGPLHPFRVDETFDVRLTVERDGRFRQYELEGVTSRYDDDLRYVERVTYVDVGETTVERPDWVETAIAELESSGELGVESAE